MLRRCAVRCSIFIIYPEDIESLYVIAGFKDMNAVLFRDDLKKFSEAPRFHTTWCLDNSEAPGFHKGFVTQYISQVPFDSFDEDYNIIIVGAHSSYVSICSSRLHESGGSRG